MDLNPVAVELAEVSLWLNTICEGAFVPWFGTQLINGNSLIGARRAGYTDAELLNETKGVRWYDHAPKRIGFGKGESSSRAKRSYQFLTGDPGMCNYDDKIVQGVAGDLIAQIKAWRKGFTAVYAKAEVAEMRRLSVVVDQLWRQAIADHNWLERQTEDTLNVYGYTDESNQVEPAREGEEHQAVLETFEREVRTTVREKDDLLNRSYHSEQAMNAGAYARLKLAMDYWCSLWFWPIEKAELLPDRKQFLADMSLILTGEAREIKGLVSQDVLDVDGAGVTEDTWYTDDHRVNLAELEASNQRVALVRGIAEERHFFHWELEFADVFVNGGFDLMIGNPPWVKLQWTAADAIADVNPEFAIHEPSASDLNKQLSQLLTDTHTLDVFLREYVGLTGQSTFYNSAMNYPLLQGQQTNLFRNFLPNAWDFTKGTTGVSAFVHPDAILGDTKAGELRRHLYLRLRKHFHFYNERKLFAGVDHHTEFSLNVYRNPALEQSDTVQFDSIWNLYDPRTIDACYASDGSGDVPEIKDENGSWNTAGHRERIVHVDREVLETFSQLVGDGTKESWNTTPVVAVYANELVSALEAMASCSQTLRDFGDEVTYSGMWHETNSRKDGTIRDDVHFPTDAYDVIYSSPFVGVGNPLLQSTRRFYRVNSDYDPIDLTAIGEDYFPRTKYTQACSDSEYRTRIQKMSDGSRFDAVYRVALRRMVGTASERTLQASCVHPGGAWVHTITGYGVHPERYALLALMLGLNAAIPYDFLVRSIGKMDIHRATVELFPVPDAVLADEICLRGLLLNCLTKPYVDLWQDCWDDSFTDMRWSKQDARLDNNRFTSLTGEWDWHTPLRTDYERRQALVELDVLASMALGITLDELIDIYRLTFTVLRSYEDDTWYDANGRIAFSKKNYGNLTYKRGDFNRIRDAQAGKTFTRTISDDTQPGGPVERTITYVAPFDTCDRIQDYRTAWEFFENKYGEQLREEQRRRAEVSVQDDVAAADTDKEQQG